MPSGPPMFGATRSAAAAEKLGYHPYPAPTAANSVPYDGRPACNNCGFCAFFGCPIHAKGDPIAMLQRAMATGRAELLTETFVSRVRFDGRRATGVDVIGPDGCERFLSGPPRGRGRRGHRDAAPAATVRHRPSTGRSLPDDPLPDHRRRIDALPHLRRAGSGGDPRPRRHDHTVTRPPGPQPPRPVCPGSRGGLVEHGGAGLPIMEAKHLPWGEHHPALMADSPIRARLWAFIMQGEDLPYAGNRVDLDPTIRDARGFPVARITYRPGRHELAASAHYGPRLAAILEEMGAEWTASPHRRAPVTPRHQRPSPRAVTTWGRYGWALIRLPRWSIPTAGCTSRQRGGGRLLGVRDLGRLRTDPDPGRPGRPGRPPPGLTPAGRTAGCRPERRGLLLSPVPG